MDEFEFIRDCLAPLAGPEGLKLQDDAALFTPRAGYNLVMTKDAMVEGVHFPNGRYGGDVAEKLLRVNLSDLAAKGARPIGYFLSLTIPAAMQAAHLRGFVTGLKEMQQTYDFTLWGGDTTATSGPLVISATFIGDVPSGQMVRRSGAKTGDDVWVSGTIGDAYLGLQNILGKTLSPQPSAQQIWTWEEAYLRPEPRLLLRKTLRKFASAALDVSDGLLADAGHLAAASEVGLSLTLEDVPFSKAAQGWLDAQDSREKAYETLLSAGDDYEVLFTANAKHRDALEKDASKLGVAIGRIGQVTDGPASVAAKLKGQAVRFSQNGYKHKI